MWTHDRTPSTLHWTGKDTKQASEDTCHDYSPTSTSRDAQKEKQNNNKNKKRGNHPCFQHLPPQHDPPCTALTHPKAEQPLS